jgi:hypothetical protein
MALAGGGEAVARDSSLVQTAWGIDHLEQAQEVASTAGTVNSIKDEDDLTAFIYSLRGIDCTVGSDVMDEISHTCTKKRHTRYL